MAPLKTDSDVAQAADESAAAGSVAYLSQQCADILEQVRQMREELSRLAVRESELRAVVERSGEVDAQVDRLRKTLRKTDTPGSVAAAIDSAPLHLEPCPYIVVDDLLPTRLWSALIQGIPPVQLFEHLPMGKQHLDVPFPLAPLYSQLVWGHLARELLPKVIMPRIVEKFRAQIDAWITLNWPGVPAASVELHSNNGRIMLRRRGYRILPHRDPKWAFITCILFLARPGDDEAWGTQFYAVAEDQEATSAAPYWIDEKRCRLIEDVKFRPNRLVVFLNSTGAHGAQIPEDAQPETLERYIYQFRVAPTPKAVSMLKSLLPEERQPLWMGKSMVDY